MRNLKKIVALGMATTMLLSSSMMVFATSADHSSGNLNASKNVTDWQVVDEDYFETLDDEFQSAAGDNWKMTSGSEGSATFENTSTPTTLEVGLQNGASLKDVTVKVYQIFNITGKVGDSNPAEYHYSLADEALRPFFKTYFSLGEDNDGAIVTAVDAIDNSDNAAKVAFANALKAFIDEKNITAVGTYTGVEGDTTHEFDLSRQYKYTYVNGGSNDKHVYSQGKGYYFVTRSDAVDDTYTLRVLDQNTNTLTLKGTKLNFDKSGDKVVMKVGDTVTYTLESKIANTNGKTDYKYVMLDRLEDTMSADKDSFEVTVGGTPLVQGVDYTVTDTIVQVDEDINSDGNKDEKDKVPAIAITFKFDSTSQLYQDAHLGETVQVKYRATMTKTATSGNDTSKGYENYNKAWLEYGDGKTEEDEWDVYSVSMEIIKKDASENVLANAEFQLYDSKDTTKSNPLKFSKHADGYYYYDLTGTSTLITDSLGKIDIHGLDGSSYILSETKAPAGYQAVDDQVITVTTTENLQQDKFNDLKAETNKNHTKISSVTVADGYIKMSIIDPTEGSADLPATGGMGRTIVYVIGALTLIGGCTVLVITRSRKRTA